MFLKSLFGRKFIKLPSLVLICLIIIGLVAPLNSVYAKFSIENGIYSQPLKRNYINADQGNLINGFGMGSSTFFRLMHDLDLVEAAFAELQAMGVNYIREEIPCEYFSLRDKSSYMSNVYFEFDPMIDLAKKYDLEIVAVLAYGPNTNYRDDDEFFSLWENYLDILIYRYGKDIHYWEIGNEMNSLPMWQKVHGLNINQVEPAIYAKMLERAFIKIKSNNNNDVVIMGGLTNDVRRGGIPPLSFVEEVNKLTNSKFYDAIGLHTYWGENMPEEKIRTTLTYFENTFTIYEYVNSFATEVANLKGRPVPIWITEVGINYPQLEDIGNRYQLSPEEVQESALLRIYTTLLSIPQGEAVFWYTYASDQSLEDFVLYDINKKSFGNIADLLIDTVPLGQFLITNELGQPLENLYEYRFLKSDGQTVSIYWKNDNSNESIKAIVNNLVQNPATAYQFDGGVSGARVIVEEGITELPILELPQFLIGSMDSNTRIVTTDKTEVKEATSTASVLLLDTSGSMDEEDITGYSKIEAAQRASTSILDVIMSEKSVFSSYTHQVGLISFNNTSTTHAALSQDLAIIKSTVDGLYASGGTGMADGLSTAIDMVAPMDQSYSKMIILLSDGLPNIGLGGMQGLDEDQVFSEVISLAGRAKANGICIHTVGLGLPVGSSGAEYSMNADFLRRIAAESGCGNYYDANTALELANTFIQIRHESLGEILLNQQGEISQDEEVNLGTVAVDQNREIVLFTLNWPGSQLTLNVSDPTGIVVDDNYPNANWSRTLSLASLVVTDPLEGGWSVKIFGQDVPEGLIDYNMLISSRIRAVPLVTPEPSPTPTPTAMPQAREIRSTKGSGLLVLFVSLALGGIGFGVYLTSERKKHKSKFTSQAVLIGCSPATQGQRIRLTKNILIGRGSSVNLHLSNPGISRTHAQILKSAGAWYIKDMNSQLGTYVNNRAVKTEKLASGDRISIGEYSWTFMLGN